MMFKPPPLTDDESNDPVCLADWVELNLLAGDVSTVSVLDVINELTEIPPDDSDESERRFEREEFGQIDSQEITSGYWKSAEDLADSAFAELSERMGWLGGRYPLVIEGEIAEASADCPMHDIYAFLVLLRARQLYPNALGDDGGESGFLFEELTKHAIGAYIGAPSNSQVRFGTAGGTRGDNLPQALPDAVKDLSGRMFEKLGEIPSSGDGDFRADAIAWTPFGDRRPGQLTLICQATISEKEWLRKEPPKRWTDRNPPSTRLIRFVARPLIAVAFPETLSLTPIDSILGATFQSIPFDRLRLLSVLYDRPFPLSLRIRITQWVDDVVTRIPL